MLKWGFKLRFWSRLAIVALISSLFVSLPVGQASATEYPPCTIQGTSADESLTGTDGNDVICTGGGNDVVSAGAGDDIVIAENGGSVDVDLGTGNDIFDGTNGSDAVVDGGDGDDELTGTPGTDELIGDEGDDSLVGGEGTDTLNGGLGADELIGSAGADDISGGPGTDVIDGGSGSDTLSGGDGDDSLVGGTEGDTIHGGDGNDDLVGEAGPDSLYGEAGTDFIDGGLGDDILVGGDGVDTLDGGFGLNMCDYTQLEPRTESCTYDDDGPVFTNFSFDQPSYEVGVTDADVKFEFDVADPSGITWISVVCWGNSTNTYPLSISLSQYEDGAWGAWGDSKTTVSTTGDNKALHVSASYAVKFGTKPGTYDCYSIARDKLNHTASWQFQSHLKVFRTPAGMPGSPTKVALTQDRPGRGVLSWTAPTTLGSPKLKDYVIQVSEDGQSWTDLADGYSTSTSLKLDNLKKDSDYWFRVRGENGGATGQNTEYMTLNWGQVQVRTLPASVANPPTSLKVTEVTSNSFQLNWAAPSFDGGSAITDFTVEVSTDAGKTWRVAKSDASTSTSFKVLGTSPGTGYLIRVAAKNVVGSSDYARGSVKTLATIPGAPQNLKISKVSYRTLSLGWSLPISNGGSLITNYKIEFSGNGGTSWSEIAHPVSASRSFNVTGLTRGKEYQFRVSAINGSGVGAASIAASATTLLALSTEPRELTLSSVISSEAQVSWTAPADDGGSPIIRYSIEISPDGGTTWFRNGWTIGTNPDWHFMVLNPGTTYTYRVTPVTKAGSGASATGTFTTTAIAPAAPRNAKVTDITASGLTISWLLPTNNGGSPITDYLVEMSSDGGGTWKAVPHVASNNLAMKITGLPSGTKRWFRVYTVTAVGISESFTSISAVTLGNAPATPTSLKVSSRTSTTVTITWSQAQVVGGSPVRNFVIEFSKDGGSTWLTAKSAVTKAQSSTISGFKSGTNYKIRVRAVNDVGSSAASTFVSVTTR